MTRDDIIRIARQVGMQGMLTDVVTTFDELERFANLVAAAERKMCAKECETLLPSQRIFDQRYYEAVEDCVATIRARRQT